MRFSKASCSVTMLGCRTCRRMSTSRWISSRLTPRELAKLCRFLMNFAANFSPVLFSQHCFTIANCPLRQKQRRDHRREASDRKKRRRSQGRNWLLYLETFISLTPGPKRTWRTITLRAFRRCFHFIYDEGQRGAEEFT